MEPDLAIPLPPEVVVDEGAAIRRAQSGDRAALHGLLRRHLPPLAALARRLTRRDRVDDLVQETLVAACRGLGGFRGECSVRTWLFRIEVRLAADPARWRAAAAQRISDVDPAQVPDACDLDPQQMSLARELRDRIEEALERLPARQRSAMHLRAAEGMGYLAIAEVLDCSEGAARMLVLAARRNLRARLGDYLEGQR